MQASESASPTPVDREKLQRLQRLSEQVRVGGKGTVRRKKKVAATRAPATDDRRLQSSIKRMGLQNLPGIEEVTMFRQDGTVMTFGAPKVQANVTANTYVLSNTDKKAPRERRLDEALGDANILSQLGPENMALAQQMMKQWGGSNGGQGLAAAARASAGAGKGSSRGDGNAVDNDDDDDDDEVPELVGDENFEQAGESAASTSK